MTSVNGITYLDGSGWAERPADLEPSVSGELSCDVAVIGGGLGGMAAALRLAELGKDVVLIEADACGWGASARNAGYLTNTLGSHPWVLDHFYADRMRPLYRFAKNAVAFTERMIDDRAIECSYRRTGNIAAAPTAAAFRRMRSQIQSGPRAVVGDAQELGIPATFPGGVHIKIGGVLNPGHLALGVRSLLRRSSARVFEQSPVTRVVDDGRSVSIVLPQGCVKAKTEIVAANAFSGQLGITPRNLTTPVWVTAVETEPVPPHLLDAAGWTSRAPITTNHLVMQSFRTTDSGSILFTTRNLRTSRRPAPVRRPDTAVVKDLVRGFRERFPGLEQVSSSRTWGGWIGMTPSTLAVAGRASHRVYYSMACNGHGLPQAPYLGALLADYVASNVRHEDLCAVWRGAGRFAPGIVNPATLRLGWAADRCADRLDRMRRTMG